jgi:hypothetical protein
VEDLMGRVYSTNGEKRNTYVLLMGKPERKKPLGRQNKIDYGVMDCDCMNVTGLAQDRE